MLQSLNINKKVKKIETHQDAEGLSHDFHNLFFKQKKLRLRLRGL